MSSRSIARCGLCCALLACSAWISVPLGPVPFTLQTLVLMLLPQIMSGREALVTVAVYVLMGCAGLPVFSSFQGGVGVLAGPTGGFIWGFVVSMVPAAAIMRIRCIPRAARSVAAAAGLLAICYALGTVQLIALSGMSAPEALAVAVLPFLVPDALKAAASMVLARAINHATGFSTVPSPRI